MNVLIVHAHPEPQSFCASMCSVATEVLQAQGHTVVVSDLYRQGFNPVASADDFGTRKNPDYLTYALEQRSAYEAGSIDPQIRDEIEKVKACDLLILSFPLFWFSVPAMMKGWIDRVFISGIFYGGKRIYAQGGMRGKKAMLALTLGGREDMLSAGGVHGELAAMLKPLTQGTLGYVGMDVLPTFAAWHVPYLKPEARAALMEQWRAHLAPGFEGAEPLKLPDLTLYDDAFRRKG
ncbi:NAD(P)H dehydrogenase [Solimonas fluminis]|uniref:NAD(P)H dehydrogenase n=1 Tax=Solimonas fluminis TaxID=2086571 RepID=A0A2S5TJE8_9GAMM|nr:NAD(P)H-dependent oxidoreductase [Solimonas fluminis]PPE75116.1 NAD(P)H dehydrogenase [Solimonas fluminis]